MAEDTGITVKKNEGFSEWYTQLVLKAKLADYSKVKGCMVIRPNGYAIWEEIQSIFDKMIKKEGVKNAYFPLFIPEEFFKKEAEHAKGFSPEVAWISNRDEEQGRLAVRPTSETIMYDSYSRWLRSYRDLPILINQWCSVVRWETSAVKLFLRTREFLWQEGHCVYETKKEADKETLKFLRLYQKVLQDYLAIPVIAGRKTNNEKFAGAEYTTTVEALMPDGKALQSATSHQLGQGFAKSFGLSFLGRDEKRQVPWQTSWGFSTRTIGALVMVHGDDDGLVLPPKIALNKVVIIPILFDKTKKEVLKKSQQIKKILYKYNPILDDREEYRPGWKYNQWELVGIPIRIEFGPRDLDKNSVILVRRDTKEKIIVKLDELDGKIEELLDKIQNDMFNKAKLFLDNSLEKTDSLNELVGLIENKKMVLVPFCGDSACEEVIKTETKGATSRCIPFDIEDKVEGKCIVCENKAKNLVYFAKSY